MIWITGFAYGSGPHVACYTSSGAVYTWGHNAYSELANGTSSQVPVPIKVETCLSNKIVVEVACGSHHTVVLTNEGEVSKSSSFSVGGYSQIIVSVKFIHCLWKWLHVTSKR